MLNFAEIYHRHPDSYELICTKRVGSKVSNERLPGPYSAPEAHAKAVALVSDPHGHVTDVLPYANKEGQYIGAFYQRGEEYAAWEDGGGRLDLADQQPQGTLLSPGEEPLRELDGVRGQAEKLHPRANRERTVRRVPTKTVKLLRVAQTDKPWPKSPAAQLVRTTLLAQVMSVAQIDAAIGDQLKALGVAFVASLVSRLKQATLVEEVPYEA